MSLRNSFGQSSRLIGMEAVPSRTSTFAPCACSLSPCGNEANTNGVGLSTQFPAPPHGPVHAATTRGQTRAQTPMPALLYGRGGHGLPPHLVMPCKPLPRRHREEPTLACQSQPPLGVMPSLLALWMHPTPGPWNQTSRNPRSPRNTGPWPTIPARYTLFLASIAKATVQEASNRVTRATAVAAAGSSSSTCATA